MRGKGLARIAPELYTLKHHTLNPASTDFTFSVGIHNGRDTSPHESPCLTCGPTTPPNGQDIYFAALSLPSRKGEGRRVARIRYDIHQSWSSVTCGKGTSICSGMPKSCSTVSSQSHDVTEQLVILPSLQNVSHRWRWSSHKWIHRHHLRMLASGSAGMIPSAPEIRNRAPYSGLGFEEGQRKNHNLLRGRTSNQ